MNKIYKQFCIAYVVWFYMQVWFGGMTQNGFVNTILFMTYFCLRDKIKFHYKMSVWTWDV